MPGLVCELDSLDLYQLEPWTFVCELDSLDLYQLDPWTFV